MSFHFPGSAPRPRRVSFEAHHAHHSSHTQNKNPSSLSSSSDGKTAVENPLLSRPGAASTRPPVASSPAHASPFVVTTAASDTSIQLQQQRQHPATKPTQGLPSARPPRASLSTGTGWVPSLWDEDEYAGSIAGPTETQPNSDDFLSPYSYNNLPNRSSSSNNNTNSISSSSNSETTTADCWVLVFGYHTEAQRQELLQHYGLVEHGNAATSRVREVRLCGPNAMALRYESPWQVVKALCRSSVTLRDGTVCAVQALSHRDPRLVQSKTTMDRPLVPMIGGSTTTIPGTDSVSSGSLLVVDEDDTPNTPPHSGESSVHFGPWKPLTEKDILLHPTSLSSSTMTHRGMRKRNTTTTTTTTGPSTNRNDHPQRSFCEQILRWILDIPDSDDE